MRAECELVAHCSTENEEGGFMGGESGEVGFEGDGGGVFAKDVVEEGAGLDGAEHGGGGCCYDIAYRIPNQGLQRKFLRGGTHCGNQMLQDQDQTRHFAASGIRSWVQGLLCH